MVKHPIKRRDVFDDMRRRFDDFLAEPFFRDRERMFSSIFREPYTDIMETDKDVIFTAEIPGIRKEDINLNVTENRIDVSVESRKEKKKDHTYSSKYGGFSSSYSTPSPINPEAVKASYKNGVLEIRAPKLKTAKGKKIDVQ